VKLKIKRATAIKQSLEGSKLYFQTT